MKISVMCGGFRLGREGGVKKAREIGASGVQMYAGDLGLDFTKPICAPCVRGVKEFVKAEGIEISAVCVELGGFACDAELIPERVEKTKRMIDVAELLEIKTVTAHIGKVPEDKTDAKYIQIKAAMTEIGTYCADRGMVFAIETGPEKAYILRAFLEDVGSAGLGINFDPANLVMCSDDDPVAAVSILAPWIKHCHAKDGICLTREVHKPWPDVKEGAKWIEVPLGMGEVDFPAWVKALKANGYDGYLAIEREVGPDPAKDIKTALDFLVTII